MLFSYELDFTMVMWKAIGGEDIVFVRFPFPTIWQ